MTRSEEQQVVITGLGMTTPLGGDVPGTWRALLAGESGAARLTEPWAQELAAPIAARVKVEPAEVLERVKVRRLDRSQQLALIAAREAWADAGSPEVDPYRLAVVMGTGIGGPLTVLGHDAVISSRGPQSVSPFSVPMQMASGAAATIGIELTARAGVHTPVSACASGAEAIATGLALIKSGRADAVLAGGSDAFIHRLGLTAFDQMRALSRRIDDPEGALRPFDSDRDGFVLAEGAGAMLLETEEHARARGARVHARLAGAGLTSDGRDMTAPDPAGQIRALRGAMEQARLRAADVVHVNAHATGTSAGDIAEASALVDGVGGHVLVSATKAGTGHMIGGSGAVEAVFTALSVRDDVLPPTRNLHRQDPQIKLDVVTTALHTRVDAALSNSFGFGGHNVVLAFVKP
ncbi:MULTISPECIES: beta-ketoacyl-[acyl-carrier-protein] synthase family protein [unclassified Streptomyces]|uniref:beta-ketoacyl-[acyl-carrier-protein] synthase family protein n=1 Tax=unclassified Streptomyces TaxID=2593676 RepID=UPI002E23D4DC